MRRRTPKSGQNVRGVCQEVWTQRTLISIHMRLSGRRSTRVSWRNCFGLASCSRLGKTAALLAISGRTRGMAAALGLPAPMALESAAEL